MAGGSQIREGGMPDGERGKPSALPSVGSGSERGVRDIHLGSTASERGLSIVSPISHSRKLLVVGAVTREKEGNKAMLHGIGMPKGPRGSGVRDCK